MPLIIVIFQLTAQYAQEISSGKITISSRQHIIRVLVHKVMALYGSYPSTQEKVHVAALIGEMLSLPSTIFYDPVSFDGYLSRGLENARRKLPGKIFFCFL